MGMYTGLRCKVIVKPEYRDEMDYLHNVVYYDWSESNLDFMREYGKVPRATFIPYGDLCYMPDSWEDKITETLSVATDGFNLKFDPATGLWTFQCSLINSCDTIEHFFELVLRRIAEKVIHLEYYYEEWEKSKFYDLVDGKIVESSREGIKYK